MAAFVAIRSMMPPRGLDSTGPIALRDLILTLALWGIFLQLTTGLGLRLLFHIRPAGTTQLERLLFGFMLGTGILSLTILGLGLVGLLNPVALSILLIAVAFWIGLDPISLRDRIRQVVANALSGWKESPGHLRVAALLVVTIAIASLINALSPPWDYDGLMYHLLGPKLFLDAGRVFAFPDNWYVNGPFAIEMLFTIGMAFGDDVFPKLVHYSFGVAFVLATYSIGSRWLSPRVGRLSVIVLLTIPTIPIWASFAYIDLGWSAYELLAVAAVLIWSKERDWRLLGIAGASLGFAMGSKYLGLFGLLVTVGLLLFVSRKAVRARAVLALCLSAGIAAAPWYVKNLVWFGNPVFPIVFGGPTWDPQRLDLYTAYLGSFGVGRQLLDYLLLPLNVYLEHSSFGTVMNSIDIPSILFPILLLVPFIRPNRIVSILVIIAIARSILWSLGSQQLRFLMPIFPLLSIGTAYVISKLSRSARRSIGKLLPTTLATGLLTVTLFYQLVVLFQFKPIPAILGYESRASFTARINKDYPSIQHFQQTASQGDKLLMLGDARGYLCPDLCIPDPDHFRWAAQIADLTNRSELGLWFREIGATHLLWSVEDLDFLLQHDPRGVMREALQRLVMWESEGCLETEFSDDWSILYRVVCLD